MFYVETELARNSNIQRFQKILFIQFYEVHGGKIMKCMEFMGRRDANVTYVSIFRNTLLNVRTTLTTFL